MYLQSIDSIEPTDELVGGKAANMAIMSKRGFNVPATLILSHSLLTDIAPELVKVFDDLDLDIAKNISNACSTAKNIISGIEIPDSFFTDTKEANKLRELLKLGAVVRSSGALEDSSSASFAGCYETYFGARSIDTLKKLIIKCWMSSVTPEVLLYKRKNSISGFVPISILIQEQIQCEKAGVCFSKAPLQKDGGVALIESNWGSCVSIVSGTVAPDRFYVELQSKVISKELGKKHTYSLLCDSGAVSIETPDDIQRMFSLSNEEIGAVTEKAIELKLIFGCEVDVEWGFSKEELVLFQCRPITTLFCNDHPKKV
jgi:pyruvate,water dikinase